MAKDHSRKHSKPAESAKADSTTMKPATRASKPSKPIKAKHKDKDHKSATLVRDSFTLPEADYVLFKTLKARCLTQGTEIKKSELLRVGLTALAALSDKRLLQAVDRLERLKAGRPAIADN
jgi:hypothetical protein